MMKPPKITTPGFAMGQMRKKRPDFSPGFGRGPDKPRGPMTKPVPASGKGPVARMAKGGAVPMKFGKKMAAFEKSPMDMREDKAGMKKMADKAKAKGKKMMPAFMKKGAR